MAIAAQAIAATASSRLDDGACEWPQTASFNAADHVPSDLLNGDSLDDICDQIRMLRSTILPHVHQDICDLGPTADLELASFTPSLSPSPVPSMRYFSSLESSSFAADIAASRGAARSLGTADAPGFASPTTELVPTRFGPSGLGLGGAGDVAGGVGAADGHSFGNSLQRPFSASETTLLHTSPEASSAVRGHGRCVKLTFEELGEGISEPGLATYSSTSSRFPARVHHTLWEERQMERCFRCWLLCCSEACDEKTLDTWSCVVHAGVSSPRMLNDPTPVRSLEKGGESPCETLSLADANHAELTVTRVNLCFRVWRRVCAARRAEEIATSVRLLNLQVSGQLRRAVARWSHRSQSRAGLRAAVNLKATTRRLALRWWMRFASDAGQQRAVRDQSCALVRVRLLRQAAKRWASRTSELLMLKSFLSRQSLRHLRRAFEVWTLVKAYRQQKATDARANILILQCMARRSVLLWWACRAKDGLRCQRLANQYRARLVLASKALAVQVLAVHMQRVKGHLQASCSASRHIVRGRRRAGLQQWARWHFHRLQRHRLLSGHATTRVRPRVLRHVLRLWLSVVRREQRHDAALHKAKIVMSLGMKSRTFTGWLALMHSTARALCILKGLSLALGNSLVGFSFTAWRVGLAEVLRQRDLNAAAHHHHERFLLAIHFNLFCLQVKAERHETHLSAVAFSRFCMTTAANYMKIWRLSVRCIFVEREQHKRAVLHDRLAVAAKHLVFWSAAVARDRLHQSWVLRAEGQRETLVVQRVWRHLRDYAVFRKNKRHHMAVSRCRGAMQRTRCAFSFQRWARGWAAINHRRHAVLSVANRASRAFFCWGRAVIKSRRATRVVVAELRIRRQVRVMQYWHELQNAFRLSRESRSRSLVAWLLRCWWEALEEAARVTDHKIAKARLFLCMLRARRGFSNLRAEMLERRFFRRKLGSMVAALDAASSRCNRQVQSSCVETLWSWTEYCRSLDMESLAQSILREKDICFKLWVQFCQQQRHKRSVHEVCNRYRDGRLLQSALMGWHSVYLHLCNVAESVVHWAAGVVTTRALRVLLEWRRLVVRRRCCCRGTDELLRRRRVIVCSTWHGVARRKIIVAKILLLTEIGRQRSWLRSWSAHATAKQVSRRRHAIAAEAVSSTRRRRWIERWCEAGRWHRLGHVAVAWDAQVMSKYALTCSFGAWSQAVVLFKKAEVANLRMSAVRASVHLKSWARLLIALEVWARSLATRMIVWWRTACQRITAYRGIARRVPLQLAFRQLRFFGEDRAKRRRRLAACCCSVHNGNQKQQMSMRLSWWRSWTAERQRKAQDQQRPEELCDGRRRRAMKNALALIHDWAVAGRCRKAKVSASSANVAHLQQCQQRRVCRRWLDATLQRRAVSFRRAHDVASIEGQGPAVSELSALLAAWCIHSKRRSDVRALGSLVRARIQAGARARLFDEWAKVYEHESTSFFASQILGRLKIARLLASWFRLATFRKRFAVQVSHEQVLQDTHLLRHCFRLWEHNLQEHRCVAAVWLDCWKNWSSGLLTAWRDVVRGRQALREHIQHFRSATLSLRSRRRADLMRLCAHSAIVRRAFMALCGWVRKISALRARGANLEARVAVERQHRRLCGWTMCSRERMQEQMLCKRFPSFFRAWLLVTRQQIATASRVSHLVLRRESAFQSRVVRSWWELALFGRDIRRGSRETRSRHVSRICQRGVSDWRRWTKTRLQHRTVCHRHIARWRLLKFVSAIRSWRMLAVHARVALCIREHQHRRSVRTCWQEWRSLAALSSHQQTCACAFESLRVSRRSREILIAWLVTARRRACVEKLASTLSQARRRYMAESEWRERVLENVLLKDMFDRFSKASGLGHAHGSAEMQAKSRRRNDLESLISHVWERQQLSVALGRLKGYTQPWVLGLWSAGPHLLLSPESPYFVQTEARLETMLALLETQQSAAHALQLFSAMYGGGGRHTSDVKRSGDVQQRVITAWHALADLIVICHPGWPTSGIVLGARPVLAALEKHCQEWDTLTTVSPTVEYASSSKLLAEENQLGDLWVRATGSTTEATPRFGFRATFATERQPSGT